MTGLKESALRVPMARRMYTALGFSPYLYRDVHAAGPPTDLLRPDNGNRAWKKQTCSIYSLGDLQVSFPLDAVAVDANISQCSCPTRHLLGHTDPEFKQHNHHHTWHSKPMESERVDPSELGHLIGFPGRPKRVLIEPSTGSTIEYYYGDRQ